MVFPVLSDQDFEGMRKAGTLARQTLEHVEEFIKPGVTTDELNAICHEFILKNNATPAPLNYKGFPKSICTSVNHVVCHGIPCDRTLKEGNILNVDVTVCLNGFYGDTSKMFAVGSITRTAQRLIDVTYECLILGIKAAEQHRRLGDIGHAIQTYAEAQHFSVVRDFCGHGIGKSFHTAPSVLHYGAPNTGDALMTGNCITIEPMINAGKHHTTTLPDGWTAVTRDRSLSAQFEHTLGLHSDHVEVFTMSDEEKNRLKLH